MKRKNNLKEDSHEELQKKKLILEIKHFRRPFYERTAFWSFLGTLLGVGLLWYNGFFDAKRSELNTEKKLLIIETRDLDSLRNQLKRDTAKLNIDRRKLGEDIKTLNQGIAQLEDEKKAINKNQKKINKEIKEIEIKKRKVERLNALYDKQLDSLSSKTAELEFRLSEKDSLLKALDQPFLVFYNDLNEKEHSFEIILRNSGKGLASVKSLKYFYNDEDLGYDLEYFRLTSKYINIENENFLVEPFSDDTNRNLQVNLGESEQITLFKYSEKKFDFNSLRHLLSKIRINVSYNGLNNQLFEANYNIYTASAMNQDE